MVTSREVPNAFTCHWKVDASQSSSPNSIAANSPDFGIPRPKVSRQKYRTSCDTCRRSRVKCSGGNPCQRCDSLSQSSCCKYGMSQRQGKRKAAASLPTTPEVQQSIVSSEHVQFGSVFQSTHMMDGSLGPDEPTLYPSTEPLSPLAALFVPNVRLLLYFFWHRLTQYHSQPANRTFNSHYLKNTTGQIYNSTLSPTWTWSRQVCPGLVLLQRPQVK